MAKGDTKTENLLDILANGTREDIPAADCCNTKTQNYILGAINRMVDLEEEVEWLENNPDVTDIVATYEALMAYDTSRLTDNDIIRVLSDETHDGNSTYYRWTNNQWVYIGSSKAYDVFTGTDGTTAGTVGLVPAPATTDAGKFLSSDGHWEDASAPIQNSDWDDVWDEAIENVNGVGM